MVQFIFAYVGGLDVYVAPFVDLKSFYAEYLYYHAHQQSPHEDIAKQSTFNAAFKLLRETKGIKMLKAKGAFQTCEICNNASELLMNKRKKINVFTYHSYYYYLLCALLRFVP